MQGSRPSQSARGINQKLLNLESSQDTVNGVRATLSKSRERINVLECSQETTSRNVETLKTDIAGPRLWNELPVSFRKAADINALKRQLRAHIFKKAYLLKLFYFIEKLVNNS